MKLRVHTYIVVLLFLSQHSPLFYVFFRNEMNLNHRDSYNNGKVQKVTNLANMIVLRYIVSNVGLRDDKQ